ncbi:MAG: hypothetical protein GY909_15855 [Oligoflexia bacterium]|nr:hypothetical protein [Oligoflexia bacterium]
MKYKNLIFLIFISLSLFSCLSKKSDDTASTVGTFDPGFPGETNNENSRLTSLFNIEATPLTPEKVSITWDVPNIYLNSDYSIYIYRIDGDGETFSLPDPAIENNITELYLVNPDFNPFKGVSYIDENLIFENRDYTYFLFIEIDGVWSLESRVSVSTPSYDNFINIPLAGDFWPSYTTRYGFPVQSGADPFLTTLSPGIASIGSPVGKISCNSEGTICYVLDTDLHRVVIYTSQAYSACKDFDKESDDYQICLISFSGAPVQATALLGQRDPRSTLSCHDPLSVMQNDECLYRPRSILVAQDKLLIGTEDGRIMVWNSLPEYGCYHLQNEIGISTPDECQASKVIGKKDFNDFTTYDLSIDGDASLFCPNDIAYNNGSIYIAEPCKSRVVKVSNALDDSLNLCSEDDWKGPLCRLDGVLGQPDLFSHEVFSDEYSTSINFDFALGKLSDDGEYLKRHFLSPSRIRFSNEKMYIFSNENFVDNIGSGTLELHGRILVYNNLVLEGSIPECRNATYSLGGCDANEVIGQVGFSGLVEVSLSGSYRDFSFTFNEVDFDVFNDRIMAVDYESNNVLIWNNPDYSILGVPYSYRVLDPEGALDSNNRVLPDLGTISVIEVLKNDFNVLIYDTENSYIYRIPLISNTL